MGQRLIAELSGAPPVHLLPLYLSLAKVFGVPDKFADTVVPSAKAEGNGEAAAEGGAGGGGRGCSVVASYSVVRHVTPR